MKVRKIKADSERKIIINMIMSTEFLREIHASVDLRHFKSSYARTVAAWVLEYYEAYEAAPEKQITDIYVEKKKYIDVEEDTGIIGRMLKSLSDESVTKNVTYTADSAIKYLKRRSLELLMEDIQNRLDTDQIHEAEKSIATYIKVDRVQVNTIDVFDDIDAISGAFNFESEVMFRLPGVLGEVIGTFDRGDFISYLAFAKRGKSYALNYAQESALAAGLNVVTFSLEMTERQNLRREWMSYTGRPKKSMTVRVPYFEDMGGDAPWQIMYDTEYREGFPKDLQGIKDLRDATRKFYRSGSHKLIVLPSRSATVKDLDTHLTNLELYEDFIPDIVIVDYADYLSADDAGNEYRHKIDQIWAALRGLALVRNICVITASQSNRFSANADLTEESVAEDIRKIAHATKMIGINQTKEEKLKQIYRYQVLAVREGGTASFDEVLALACLDAGRFVVDSRLVKECDYEKEKPKTKKQYT